jgi:hypothetical protein
MRPHDANPAAPAQTLMPDPAIAAFDSDLPELLIARPGQWVAYQGKQCLGFGHSQCELFQRCVQRGLKEGEFIVRFISTAALADHEETDVPFNP